MRKTAIAAMIALGALTAPAAHAIDVTTWGYTVTTEFVTAGAGAPTFTAGGGVQNAFATEISWGSATGSGSPPVVGIERSGLLIENAPQSGSITTNSLLPQPTATFAHVNNPISGDFATLLTATIETTLTLTPTDPAGDPLDPQEITFLIRFAETPNDGSCVDEATSNCDDVFVVTFGSLNQSFDYEGTEYFASIVKTNGPLDPLSPSACAAAGSAFPCLGFVTAEAAKTAVDFGIIITSRTVTVPEPGMLALVGLGLAGMGFVSRRRRQA